MKTMHKYLFLLCFTLFSYCYGQQSAPWTLEAAVEHAVKNNLQIRAAYLDVMDAKTYKSQQQPRRRTTSLEKFAIAESPASGD